MRLVGEAKTEKQREVWVRMSRQLRQYALKVRTSARGDGGALSIQRSALDEVGDASGKEGVGCSQAHALDLLSGAARWERQRAKFSPSGAKFSRLHWCRLTLELTGTQHTRRRRSSALCVGVV